MHRPETIARDAPSSTTLGAGSRTIAGKSQPSLRRSRASDGEPRSGGAFHVEHRRPQELGRFPELLLSRSPYPALCSTWNTRGRSAPERSLRRKTRPTRPLLRRAPRRPQHRNPTLAVTQELGRPKSQALQAHRVPPHRRPAPALPLRGLRHDQPALPGEETRHRTPRSPPGTETPSDHQLELTSQCRVPGQTLRPAAAHGDPIRKLQPSDRFLEELAALLLRVQQDSRGVGPAPRQRQAREPTPGSKV